MPRQSQRVQPWVKPLPTRLRSDKPSGGGKGQRNTPEAECGSCLTPVQRQSYPQRTKAQLGGKTGKHRLRGRAPAASLRSQGRGRAAALAAGHTAGLGASSEGLAGPQHGSSVSAGLRLCTFPYSSFAPPAPARSAAAAAAAKKRSPRGRLVKKNQNQNLLFFLCCSQSQLGDAAPAKVIMKQIKSQTQALLFPTPKSQHCTKLLFTGKKSQKTVSPNPPRN